MGMHENQLIVTLSTARALIESQFPEWASLDITPVNSEGTVNAIFRIGDGLSARLPLLGDDEDVARSTLSSEVEAARELQGRTRFPTPSPVAIGDPGFGYPMPWSVWTWLPGRTASVGDPSSSLGLARDLAEFVAGVRSMDVNGRKFGGDGRGGDLTSHETWMETCFNRSGELVDVPRLRRVWSRLSELPRESPDAMTHGDLTPGNLLVDDGRLVGVLDVGGLGPADPALDLVGAWHLFEAGPRDEVRARLRSDDLEWQRGKAWALQQAISAVWYYVDTNPVMSRMGRVTLERILEDESGP